VQAKKPCVLLGTQVWTCRGTDAAINFVKTLNIPAFMNGAGRGTLPPSDPHHFQQTRRYAFDKADVIVIVGTPFDFRMGYGRRLPANASVVQIDMDYRTVGKNRDISLGLVGDVGAILGAVTQAVSGRVNRGTNERKPWMEELRAEEDRLQGDRMARLKSDAQPIHPLRLCYEINEFLREDSVYIGDGGDIVTFSGGVVQPSPLAIGWTRAPRHVRCRRAICHGLQAGAAAQRGGLPLWRRCIHADRLGLRDDGTL